MSFRFDKDGPDYCGLSFKYRTNPGYLPIRPVTQSPRPAHTWCFRLCCGNCDTLPSWGGSFCRPADSTSHSLSKLFLSSYFLFLFESALSSCFLLFHTPARGGGVVLHTRAHCFPCSSDISSLSTFVEDCCLLKVFILEQPLAKLA